MKKIVYEESKVDIQFCCIHKSKMMKTSGTKLKKKSKQKNNKIGEVVAKMVDKAKSSLISSHRHNKFKTTYWMISSTGTWKLEEQSPQQGVQGQRLNMKEKQRYSLKKEKQQQQQQL